MVQAPKLNFPPEFGVLAADPDVLESYSRDAISHITPQAVARPKSVTELSDLVRFCAEHRIAITPSAGQTSMTAGCLSDTGVVLSTRALDKDYKVGPDPKRPGHYLAEAGPAIYLAEFQKSLEAQGYFYPPDPTSRTDALLGATIATNASGEDSFKYGSTRRWVRGLDVILADGTLQHFERDPDKVGSGAKNTCGFPFRDEPIDWFIGSEGTLGIITRIWIEVLKGVPDHFALLLFFPSEEVALKAVQTFVGQAYDMRCLEYLDAAALDILRAKAEGFECLPDAKACLYIKQEYQIDQNDALTETWLERITDFFEGQGLSEWADATQFFDDPESKRLLRRWRHTVPATINERAYTFKAQGGGKVGTDWYVPVDQLVSFFQTVRKDQSNMEWVVFGHIGNGHPHFNFIAKNADEYRHARELLLKHCQLAVTHGGGVSGEHGLGKLKTHLLAVQYSDSEIAAMKALKNQLDPHGILSPGNIFPN
ncbi:MAG: FAD-binding oxidoreductase [Acidobacteria bacterium]|nr:FAD-binding oxidoreductase [Acidobacteriota bacterium]